METRNQPVHIESGTAKIQDLNLVAIGQQFGTPLYLYDLDLVAARYREMTTFFKNPSVKIHYAMKANYNPEILKVIKAENGYLDTVSPSEVFFALELGFNHNHILFTANNMTDEEMRLIHAEHVLFNIDSLSRLEKYGQAFPGSNVCLRFNSDVVAGEHKHIQTGGEDTKFGILLQNADDACAIAKSHNLKIVGLHEHTGSGIADAEKFCDGMKNLLAIATPERFPDLEFLDFGGGFKVPYRPDEKRIDYVQLGETISALFADFCKGYGRELTLCFEPGKYIVAEAGILLVQVNTLKSNAGRAIAGVNSGFSQLIRPLLYDAYHPILNISNPTAPTKKYDICGNICETGDLFAKGREISEIREGDYLAILNAGAYGFSMASIYNLRALPAEAVVSQNKVTLSRPSPTPRAFAETILTQYL